MNEIETAINQIKSNTIACQQFVDYYDGNHALAFASEKFRNTFGATLKAMRENLCPIVVDAPADRMEIINFSGDKGRASKAIANKAWAIWQREQMELVSTELHIETLKT